MTDKHCFNCEEKLFPNVSYCSNCGQRVDDNNLTLKAVFHEFIENYLSFDTRIGRTILPFLFQPGKLVSEFIKGKRVTFVNPFRFYLLISIFFFFILGAIVDKTVNQSKSESEEIINNQSTQIDQQPSELTTRLQDFAVTIDSLEKIDSVLVLTNMDSLLKAHNLDSTVTFSVDSSSTIKERKNFVKLNSSGTGFNINVSRLKDLKEYRYDKSITDEDFLDSLRTDSLSKYERLLAMQSIRMFRSDSKVITRFILGNLSLSMIALIPGLAFIFLLFYYKQRLPYVGHLIHSLQIHTFSLFVYAIGIIGVYFFDTTIFIWIAFLVSAVYFFFSLKKVYPKSTFSTFWRFVLVGILYYFYWAFVITLGIIISFLLF